LWDMERLLMCEVGLFFYVDGRFLVHTCDLNKAEDYGEFKIYPYSHNSIWNRRYAKKFGVDFDYYPRGRVAYRKTDDTFIVFYDRCIEDRVKVIVSSLGDVKTEMQLDEHYQCHKCNMEYII